MPPRIQPRAKAPTTSNLSTSPAGTAPTATISTEPLTIVDDESSRGFGVGKKGSTVDGTSDRATQMLIQRTLANKARGGNSLSGILDTTLPPLSSSNEVDVQLYAFIAIIIREFVQVWYARITPDTLFVEEVVRIIAHCSRAIEQRLRLVDVESLLFDEIPALLEVHIKAYRTAHSPLYPSPIEPDPRQIYHALCPIRALSPVPVTGDENAIKQQAANEEGYRQLLVQGILAVLLPTEDLENDCLTALVGQVFSEMILGGVVGGRACEPWLLWEGITKMAELIQAHLPESKAEVRHRRSNSDLGGLEPSDTSIRWKIGRSLDKWFWLLLQYAFVAFTAARFVILSISNSSSLPSRANQSSKIPDTSFPNQQLNSLGGEKSVHESVGRSRPAKQPILTMKIWSCITHLLDMDARMPWLSAALSLIQWELLTGPGQLGNTDGRIDRLLSHTLTTHTVNPSLLPSFLRSIRGALFPNNTLAPPRSTPCTAEQLVIRHNCALAILALIPVPLQDIYFGRDGETEGGDNGGVGQGSAPSADSVGEQQRAEADANTPTSHVPPQRQQNRRIAEVELRILDLFSDPYCNKHLLYSIVELLVVRLIPELADKSIAELWGERLG